MENQEYQVYQQLRVGLEEGTCKAVFELDDEVIVRTKSGSTFMGVIESISSDSIGLSIEKEISGDIEIPYDVIESIKSYL